MMLAGLQRGSERRTAPASRAYLYRTAAAPSAFQEEADHQEPR